MGIMRQLVVHSMSLFNVSRLIRCVCLQFHIYFSIHQNLNYVYFIKKNLFLFSVHTYLIEIILLDMMLTHTIEILLYYIIILIIHKNAFFFLCLRSSTCIN